MQYNNLQELIYNSSSTRKYFLSLPVLTQMDIHKYNNQIHSAKDLRILKERLEKYNHHLKISEERLF